MKASPFFSIVTPIHSSSRDHLKEYTKGILSQTCHDFELILIVDDATPIPAELKELANSLVVETSPCSIGAARNLGIGVSKGCYLVFIDSDDAPKSWYLTRLWETIRKHEEPDVLFIKRKGEPYHEREGALSGEAAQDYLLHRFLVWQAAYSRAFLAKHHIQFEDISRNEDFLFCLDLAASRTTLNLVSMSNPYRLICENNNSYSHSVLLKPDVFRSFLPLCCRKMQGIDCSERWVVFSDFIFGMTMELPKLNTRSIRALFSHFGDDRAIVDQCFLAAAFSNTINRKMRFWCWAIAKHWFVSASLLVALGKRRNLRR